MRPLTSVEIFGNCDFDIGRAIRHGLIPSHYIEDNYKEELRSYVADYLTEEIAQEGSVRSLPAFSHFLRVASITNSELLR